MQKILIIQTAFIGDVVLATGVAEKMHLFFPGAEIDFLVRQGNEALLLGHPFLYETLVWHKKQHKYKHLFILLKKILARKYDAVFNLQRFAATGLLTAFSGARQTVGFDKNPLSFLFTKKIPHRFAQPGETIHEIERNNDLVAFLTNDIAAKPRLYPTSGDYVAVQQYTQQPYLCIAPASVWFTKQFPAEKWVALINALPTNFNVYLIGGPADKALCEAIRQRVTNSRMIDLCGSLTFLQSAALQQGAVMNYVNDSAPMHFASAVNAPVTAIYCSTVPSFGYGPLSSNSTIVQTEEPLRCRPCGIHGHKACPLGHFNCAYSITNQQLLQPLPITMPLG